MTRFRVAAALAACLLTACDKTAVQDISGPPAGAQVRFFHFGVNAPGVHFYANDAKLTAIGSTNQQESTTGTTYGGVGSGGYYSAIDPGTYAFTGRIAATVDKDLIISTVNAPIVAGVHYSVYLSGFYDAGAKTVGGFIVEDPFPAYDYTVAYVRFVHAISNAAPMRLIGTNTVTAAVDTIGGLVSYQAAGAFEPVVPGTYNLVTRYDGAGTNAITRNSVAFAAGKVYTIGARGDITVVSTTATNRPILDNTANR